MDVFGPESTNPFIAAQTDYICNLPSPIARTFAGVFNPCPTLGIPEPELIACWHTRFDADEGLQWLRVQLKDCAVS